MRTRVLPIPLNTIKYRINKNSYDKKKKKKLYEFRFEEIAYEFHDDFNVFYKNVFNFRFI